MIINNKLTMTSYCKWKYARPWVQLWLVDIYNTMAHTWVTKYVSSIKHSATENE